jgi:asparagine synthase (glutamine-hydrolysing)
MCGIYAYLGKKYRIQDLLEYFRLTYYRGPDDQKMVCLGRDDHRVILGFHRLSIIDVHADANQPLYLNNLVLICNGEIYNYKELIRDHELHVHTGSDCEVIIHLYKKYGIEKAIQMLDGVFAFVLFDGNTGELVVGRDPFGVRPMFMGKTDDDETLICSEIKSIHAMCKGGTIKQFPGGCWMKIKYGQPKSEQIPIRYYEYKYPVVNPMGTYPSEFIDMICAGIRDRLVTAVIKRLMSDRPIGSLLSGGLDSSLITGIVAREFKKRGKGKLRTFVISIGNGPDLAYARKVADYIGSDHHEIILTEKEFLKAIMEVIYNIESYDTTTVRASVGNYLVAKYIKQNTDVTVVYNGDGSDEQSGYIYLANAPSTDAFQHELERLLSEISFFDVLRSDRSVSSHWSLEARTPFLDKDFVQYYMSIDPKLKMYSEGDKIEKYLLRRAFADEKIIPDEVLWRRKEAFSDGCSDKARSWHTIISEHVNEIYSDEEFEARVKFIEHNKPQLKESLYYRDIFEGHFGKKHVNVIPHFWMPNWTDQIDPSARELEVYDREYTADGKEAETISAA